MNHNSKPRKHLWKVELGHCLFSGAIVFIIFYVIAGFVIHSAQIEVGWKVLLYSMLAAHMFVLSLLFFAVTFLKYLRLPGTIGMVSCIMAGNAVCGLYVVVLGIAIGEVPPVGLILSFCILGSAFGWIYRLCQNAYFEPAVSTDE